MKSFALTKSLVVGALALIASAQAQALNVFACEAEWGALTKELAGDAAEISVATTALQDVHFIEAKPSLIAKIRRADLVVCTGASLEVGWLPQLLRQAGNSRVASGPGSFMAASFVQTLERPAQVDRANGDVHPEGNPHIHLDPHRVLAVAKALAQRLAEVDAGNAATYQSRYADFEKRWTAAMATWEAKAAPLKGKRYIVHHTTFTYLFAWLGLTQVATLEPKPGVPPTSSHLAELEAMAKSGVSGILYAAYQDPKASAWLSERTGVPAIQLPFTVGGNDAAQDLFGLYDSTLDALLKYSK